jgi:hypothetical protein
MCCTQKLTISMPRINKNFRQILLALLLPVAGFSQKDSNQNSIITIKQVDELRIGNKPEVNKIELSKPEVLPVRISNAMSVVDSRDNVEFQIIPIDDDIVAERIRGLENIMPMPYNEHVKK